MLKGDLTSTPLAPLLLELANDGATGCLHISDRTGEEALVYLKAGLVNSISVPGVRPQLGAKLVSSGALAPEALAEALEAQRTELQGWRLGELLVHLGYVEHSVVEAFVKEQVCDALWDLLRWPEGNWKFRKNITARDDVAPPTVVVELLEQLRARGYEWEVISQVVHGPAAVPTLSANGEPNTETTLDNDAWSMLCKIDGERSVADLARDCGYTMFEAGHIIVSLVQAGLVDIDENVDIAGQEPYGATTLMSALVGAFEDPATAERDESSPVSSEDATATDFAHVAVGPAQRPGATYEQPTIVHRYPHGTESFATSIALVSSALSDVLGEAPATETQQVSRRVAPRRPAPEVTDDAEWERRKRHRTAAAAELASAQALIETLRAENPVPPQNLAATPVPAVRQPAAESEAAAPAGEAAAPATEAPAGVADRDDAETAARSAAERFAKAAAEEAERDAAAQAAQRLAEEQAAQAAAEAAAEAERRRAAEAAAEAERVRAEVEAAETQAWQEYEQREVAERQAAEAAAAAEESARLAAEAAEAERLAAEAAERLAAEAAEAERLAAEEAARLAAEEAAAQAAAVQAQQQAEEAARIAAEAAEAERLAAEEAERVAAEEAAIQAAAAEAQRRAAEEAERAAAEAARQAAEAEAERVAAETAEREAAQAAEREAVEAAEREAVVAAAAELAAQAAAEAASEQAAAEEAALQADEAAAASALLIELANETAMNEAEAAGDQPADGDVDATTSESDGTDRGDADDDDDTSSTSWRDPETTDTAALLRELSSLGGDDDRGPSGTAPRAARPAAADKKVKKKIGLFGL